MTSYPLGSALPVRTSFRASLVYRKVTASIVAVALIATSTVPAFAGGYVDGNVVLNPARAINTGAVSITPSFNNDQFNDQLLVGTVNNDPIRTPSTSDPVSTVTGNNYHDETDFVIRGRNGLNLVFTRTYNSAPSSTKADRGVGFGWVHSYMMRLKSNDFGDCPNCTSAQRPENANAKTSSITYTDERGGEQNYLVNETSFAVSSPKGIYDTLTLDSPSPGQHTLTFRNGVRYIFETPTGNLRTAPNVVARLRFIDNAWGDRLSLSYDPSGRLAGIADNLGIAGRTGITLTYDANNRLKDVSDWTARKWSFAYDTSGNLTSKTNALAEVTAYAYETARHLLTTITKPIARDGKPVQTKFKYYENGRTFQQTNSFDVGDTLDYDLYRKSTRVTDARGNVREYHYDENGRMTKLVEPNGAVLLFENQGDAIRSKKFDALGYATTYSYRADRALTGSSDVFGNVTREVDALGRTVDMAYGPLDQVSATTDKRGGITTTLFATSTSGCDFVNRPREMRINTLAGASNVLLSSYCWNSNATLNYSRQYFDATRYRETRLTYEPASNGLNVSQEQLVGMPANLIITKLYTYDSLGRKKTETLRRRADPDTSTLVSLTTSYDYDALDRVTKVTDSLGNEVINSFDANGQVWKVTHRYRNGASFEVRDLVTRTFDAADRVKTETDSMGNLTTFSYDDAGNLIALLDAEGHTTRFEYDAMNRKAAVIDATGYRTETIYSLRGDVLGVRNANGETTVSEIDALGRKTALIDARGFRSEFRYDENGNLTCSIDANGLAGTQPRNSQGCSETRSYDELNRVVRILDALNGETRFSYDLAGNRLTVIDAESKTWRFAYDDLGRLANETDHGAQITTYATDEAGNVYRRVNRLNELTRFTYDLGNRLIRADYAKDNTTDFFAYSPAGMQNNMSNGNVIYTFDFDNLNRMTRKNDSRGRSLVLTYDRVGNVLTKTTFQGSTTSYVYNAANRLVMLRNPDYTQVNYQYDPAGRLLSRVTANGARMTQAFDANGWMSRQSQFDAANVLISDTSYSRDRVGNIIGQTDASGATTFTLDGLYRVIQADYPGAANDEVFTYDRVGNRKTYTRGSLVANATTRHYNYTTGSNRLVNIRIGNPSTGAIESAFTHDLEGRLTAQTGAGAKSLTWDAKGRVKTVGAESYSYDPLDYRIGRTGGVLGGRSYFLEGEHLESEYSGSNVLAKYFRGASVDELVAAWMVDSDNKLKPFLFHQDQVSSTMAVSGHNGGTTQAIKYSAFGALQSGTGASPNRLRYTGREDDGTGLYYYRARYYDPVIGRFISEDPLGFGAGDVNFYQYTSNNPINANDPSGNCPSCVGAGVSVLAGGLIRGIAGYAEGGWSGAANAALDAQAIATDAALGAVGAGIANKVSALARLSSVPSSVASFSTKLGASASAKIDEGIYLANTNAGSYVGQSGQVTTRLGQHVASGKLGVDNASDAIRFSVGGGKLSREVAEQRVLNSLGGPGASNVLNKVNPIGSARTSYLDDLSIGVADSIYVPNISFGMSALSGGGASSAFRLSGGSPAGGGFLLYPNKSNINTMQSVYSK